MDLSELKNITAKVKNALEGINSTSDDTEEWISSQENRIVEFTQLEDKKEKRIKKNEDSIRELWDNIKCTNIRIIGVPEGDKREKGTENLFEEIMAENFPNLAQETDIQVQEAQRVPNKMNPKRPTPRHIIIMLLKVKDKERILKAAREKLVTYKGIPIRLSADFSTETLEARREWHDIFNMMKGKTYNQEYSTQQGYHSELKERSRFSQTSNS